MLAGYPVQDVVFVIGVVVVWALGFHSGLRAI